ncbi:TIR domain-containing protein [Erythrobacter mangrovi]|uniref:TIR domain-containing protein n=1 Tax=Erythrobacter mangrovi TaxID=2739433 RepID=A0A7D3XDP0_9SPHN|nr:TIR domain-containing protein [Erythrobacter mangrovi]QKG72420.1 TIR domain-containing protein [Erythrobacter mangrovi]
MDMDAEEQGQGSEPAPRVFVSYSRTDLLRARPVIDLLVQAGIDVWWDGLLAGGETYLPTTEAALEGADCVVVLWSAASVDSNWVRDEAQSGRDRRRLVPLSLDGTMPPLGFRQFQMIDLTHWNGKPGAPEADKVLQAVYGISGAPAPLPTALSPPTARGLRVSRRTLALGGAGIAGLAAIGVWRMGLLPGARGGRISMAVLPFANLSGDAEQRWFSDGLSNELRAVLARNPHLRVSAPTTSSALGEGGDDDFAAARKLGVANILRGSVQLADMVVRVSCEVIQVSDGLVRWADSFDRKMDDVFALQTEIARTVALSLVSEIAGDAEARDSLAQQEDVGGTTNLAAYEAYLRGHAFYDLSAGVETDRAALAQFDAAIAADPRYGAAHAMRATMLAAVANAMSGKDEIRRFYDDSIASAKRAIELAPDLARGHLALGYALANGRLDPKSALPHYEKARELAPGDADVQRSVAAFYAYGAKAQLGAEIIADVIELDPLNARAFRTAGYIAYLGRDFPQTISRMRQALDLNPKLASSQSMIGNALYLEGDPAGALKAYREEPVAIFALTGEAIALGRLGDRKAAEKAMAQLVADYGDATLYQQAQVRAQWGEQADALTLLERALAMNDPGMLLAPNDGLLDPLRGSPRFRKLLSSLTS